MNAPPPCKAQNRGLQPGFRAVKRFWKGPCKDFSSKSFVLSGCKPLCKAFCKVAVYGNPCCKAGLHIPPLQLNSDTGGPFFRRFSAFKQRVLVHSILNEKEARCGQSSGSAAFQITPRVKLLRNACRRTLAGFLARDRGICVLFVGQGCTSSVPSLRLLQNKLAIFRYLQCGEGSICTLSGQAE